MPEIVVRAYATLKEMLPSGNLQLSAGVGTVGELVDYIGKEYNPKFKEALIDPPTGRIRLHNKILVNGRNISFLDGLDTRLRDGDAVVFIPPVGGG